MDDELLKLECLKAAQAEGQRGRDATKRAQEIFDFLKGRGQGDAIKAQPAPKADVVGKDGDFEKPFKDYLKD